MSLLRYAQIAVLGVAALLCGTAALQAQTMTPDRLGVWGHPAALSRPGYSPVATFQIGYVEPGGPADQLGLRVGDKILFIGGVQVYDTASVRAGLLEARKYPELHVSFERAATGELLQSWSRFYLDPYLGRYVMYSRVETAIPTTMTTVWPVFPPIVLSSPSRIVVIPR